MLARLPHAVRRMPAAQAAAAHGDALVELPARLERQLLGAGWRDEPQPTACNVTEAHVVAVEAPAVAEEHTIPARCRAVHACVRRRGRVFVMALFVRVCSVVRGMRTGLDESRPSQP
jgi:hypothetical protein